MALSQHDIDALDRAIVSGELTVSVDGKSVTYRSISELKKAREHALSVLAADAGAPRRRVFYFTRAGSRDA